MGRAKAPSKNTRQNEQEETECPQCQGIGILLDALGNSTKCPCGLWDNEKAFRRLREARIPSRYASKTLDTFKAEKADTTRLAIKQAAKAFASTFSPPEDRGLILRGGVGAGKTHIAVGILTAVIHRGYSGLYYNFTDMMARLRSTYNKGADVTEDHILEEIDTCDLLILDDLGAEAATDWVRDRLYLIINRRYESARPLIVTTNCTDHELAERIGPRIVSRLHEMCDRFEAFPNEDYRLSSMK